MINKIKILIVMQAMNVGGVEKALLSLLSVIPKDKYTVELILSKKIGDFLDRIPEYVYVEEAPYRENMRPGEGIRDILSSLLHDRRYGAYLKLFVAALLNKLIRYDKALARVLYKDTVQQYDFVFNFVGVNTLAHLLCKNVYNAGAKYIWVHGDSDADGFLKYADVYAAYDRIFCVSESVTKKFKTCIPDQAARVDTVYNEIDKADIVKMGSEGSGISHISNEVILLSVGRLDACKGYDIAVAACDIIVKDGYKVKWYIVGEGEQREKLEKAVKEKNLEEYFILLGLKVNPYPYFKTTDIYVQTSISEGYCITLAEAKTFNKPIVTTNFSGANEQIANGKNGYIVPADAKLIAEHIEWLMDHEEVRIGFVNQLSKEKNSSSFDMLAEIMNSDRNKERQGD